MKYYKILWTDRMPCNGGSGQWKPPGQPIPPIEGEIIPCKNGYHILTADQLVIWLGPEIWEIDPASVPPVGADHIVCDDKHVVRTSTLLRRVDAWNDRTARLFSADCAEHVVHLVPDELRVVTDWAIDAARRFARGETNSNELDAARAAAWDAGDAGAVGAVGAVWAVGAARAAARDARAAVGEAARVAEYKWQTDRLMEYLEGGLE